jgi:hypothetical protein
MAMSKIPIWRPVTTGYRDTWNAIRAMPMMAGYAFLIMLAVNLLEYLVPTQASESGIAATAISFAASTAQNFFVTPIMIAVHRYVILEQVTPNYRLAPGHRVFRAFFGWLMALSVLGLLSTLMFGPKDEPSLFSLGFVMSFMIALVVVSIRLSILFPAIAVEAPGATPMNAWYDSKQNTFRILLIFVLSVLPLVIGALVFVVPPALNDSKAADAPLGIPAMIGMSVVQAFFLILCVAIASRIYQALANRLLRAA